jgi:hypothetical protein
MTKTFTLYTDQLKRVIERVEENARVNPLANNAITVFVSEDDPCLRMFQKIGHDWIYLDEEEFCETK